MTKNEIACRIADALLARGATGRGVPNAGTMGDLLRDYERAGVNEQLVEPRHDLAPDRHEVSTLEHLAEVRL